MVIEVHVIIYVLDIVDQTQPQTDIDHSEIDRYIQQ